MSFRSRANGSLECVFPTEKFTGTSRKRKILVFLVETLIIAGFLNVEHGVCLWLEKERHR